LRSHVTEGLTILITGAIIAYGVNSAQVSMMKCTCFRALILGVNSAIDKYTQPTSGRTTPATLMLRPVATKSLWSSLDEREREDVFETKKSLIDGRSVPNCRTRQDCIIEVAARELFIVAPDKSSLICPCLGLYVP
jgi:hypothetical protein